MRKRKPKLQVTGMLATALKGPPPARAADSLIARARALRSKIVSDAAKDSARETKEIAQYLMRRKHEILDQLGARRDPRAASIRRYLAAENIEQLILAVTRYEGLDGRGHAIRDRLTTVLGTLLRFATTLDQLAPLSDDQLGDFLLAYEDVTELWVLSLVADVNFRDPAEAKSAEPWLKDLRRCRGCGAKLLGSGRHAFCGNDCRLKTHKQRVRKAEPKKKIRR